jgi:hypothetical protein
MYDQCEGLLLIYFADEFYDVGVQQLRADCQQHATTQQRWQTLVTAVHQRQLEPGQPLRLVHHGANKVLAENSDAEAYRWLELLIHNVERRDDIIDLYHGTR